MACGRGRPVSVLAIDTATRRRLVVIRASRRGELLAARTGTTAALPWLDRALAELGVSGLEAVVVVTGPGSYTGLRAGMAAGLGVAHALGIPLHGMGSLEVTARSAPTGRARRSPWSRPAGAVPTPAGSRAMREAWR